MTTAIPGPATAATDAEKLDVYRVALAAHAQATTILAGDLQLIRPPTHQHVGRPSRFRLDDRTRLASRTTSCDPVPN